MKLANRCRNEGRDVDPQTLKRLEKTLFNQQFTGYELSAKELQLSAEVRLELRFRQKINSIDDHRAIDQDYITWGEYQLFLEAQATGQFHSQATLVQINPEQINQAVTGITFEDARWFCAWLGTQANLQPKDEGGVYDYRLPTQEELQQFPVIKQGQLVAWTDSPISQGNALRVVRVQFPTRYKGLLNYLANGRWREADEETASVMLEVTGQKDQGYLNTEDIEKFPCQDLRIIDRLWVKFSGGRFGFSVQKQIYLETGNKPDGQYREKEYKRFGDRIKWYVNNDWLDYDSLTFSVEVPEGHLPSPRAASPLRTPLHLGVGEWSAMGDFFSRVETCKL